MSPTTITQAYLSPREAAKFLGRSYVQLNLWRRISGGPRYTKLAHVVRYSLTDLVKFMEDRAVTSTSEANGSHPERNLPLHKEVR